MKRGQVTLYVVIAILIVVAAGIVVYTQREFFGIKVGINPIIRPIDTEIQGCLTQTAENGIYLIGMQGGYVSTPVYSFETNFSTIAYVYIPKQSLLPSISKIESELSGYINTMLPECMDFEKWSDFTASTQKVDTNIRIEQNEVLINAKWPVSLSRQGTTYTLNEFSAKVPVRLGLIWNVSNKIVKNELANTSIDVPYFTEVYEKYNLSINIAPYNGTIVYQILDPKSLIYNLPYNFLFAIKI